MAEHCYGSLQVCALRVAALTAGGAPDPGVDNGYVSDAIIQATIGVEVEEGDELILKNGCGALCQTFKDTDRIKRATVDLELCQLDAELIQLLIGGDLFSDTGTGDTIGYQLPFVADAAPNGVCLELWSKAWDGASQATPTFLGGNAAYFHWVFPLTKWQMGDMTLENDILTVTTNGFGTENSSMWVGGPYNDWNVDVENAGGITAAFGWFFDDVLPTAECGFVEVPARDS